MLQVLGSRRRACDGVTRRELMRVGALSLFGGVTLPTFLRASENAAARVPARAKSVILVNLFGGPPHQDMFDMKPNAPANIRGELKPISTSVPGLQICELMPRIAKLMNRASLIRSYSHKYNSHNPYNVLTGYDGGSDRENYFSKVTDHPSMGSICQYLGMGRSDLPRYVMMPAFPGYTQALRRAGPYGGYLGSQFDPLFTVCSPKWARKGKGDYDSVTPVGEPTPPSLDILPGINANRFGGRRGLLNQFDQTLSAFEASGAPGRMNKFKRQALQLLSSTKTRHAFDLSKETNKTRERYGHNLWGSSLLVARRLVEAGSLLVTVNWEAKENNHWDLHANNFGMLKVQLPVLDRMVEALVTDLDNRGRLDDTLVVVMGEMGRTPNVNKKAGRDHWPQMGFSLLFGGGTKRGFVLGKSDKHAAYPVDRPVSAGDMVATIYQLMGINPKLTVPDLGGRPVHISHGGEPAFEVFS